MTGVIYLGWRYLVFHRVKTLLLVACITLVLYLPAALQILVEQTEKQLTRRAQATPLLLGAKGSPLELVLNSLYFDSRVPNRLEYADARAVRDSGLADAIPLYVRFQTRGHPIVGTTLDYFQFRGLKIARGTQMQRLGDCVVGSQLAKVLGLEPGETIVSSPETVFDLAGVYPLKMRVTGVLALSAGPDDEAIFTDIKTAWIIEGLAHGHTNLDRPEATPRVLRREGNRITANASVMQYNEITDANIESFHFHGDVDGFPITAVIAVPPDDKSKALLMGRYVDEDANQQIVVPSGVVGELLARILTVQQYVTLGMALLTAATLAIAGLVFLLSLRLRRREIETLHKIGGSRVAVTLLCSFEIVFVLAVSSAGATLLAGLTRWSGFELIRFFL
jgi:putative ABC transport system permease protein